MSTHLKKLLLISYHFPPSHKVGGLRWQKFVGCLFRYGWNLEVVTLDPEDLVETDPERAAELPTEIRVVGVRNSRVFRAVRKLEEQLLSVRDSVRRALTVQGRRTASGDSERTETAGASPWIRVEELPRWPVTPRDFARAYNALAEQFEGWAWARHAGRTARRLAGESDFSAVISSGPPHTAHLAVLPLVRRQEDLPWIMDYRDPWSLFPVVRPEVASPAWSWLTNRMERRCIEVASHVVCNTDVLRRQMCERFPSLEDRTSTVMNGYDDDQVPPSIQPDRFRVVYAGTIYVDRDPRPFLRAAKSMIESLTLTPADFAIDFVGNVFSYGGLSMSDIVSDLGLEGYVSLAAKVPRSQIHKIMARATVLLSLPQSVDAAVPSKIFEYMKFPAWILALSGKGSATEEVLRDTPADVIDPNDVDAIARFLAARYREFETVGQPEPAARSVDLSRRSQAEKLHRILEEITATGQYRPAFNSPDVP